MDCIAVSAASEKDSYLLICSHIVLSSLWKAKHPTHNPAAIETPALVANLSPSPSMLHFHHTLCHKALLLCRHEDRAKTDLLNSHLTLPLREYKCHYCYIFFYK